MVVPVCEVIDVVASHCVDAVVHCSLVGPLPCASEVSLQGWGPGVQVTHYVCVVGPSFSENGLESLRELLERRNVPVRWQINKVHFVQLIKGYVSTEHTLDHISPIETVHAVGSERALLCLYYLEITLLVKHLSVVHATAYSCHKVSIILKLVFANINKFGKVFPFHFFALTVKIKPDIAQTFIFKFFK